MQTFISLLAAWPSRDDVAADCGVDVGVVKQWLRRNRVPAEYWIDLVDAAARRGIQGVTCEALVRIAAQWRRRRVPESGSTTSATPISDTHRGAIARGPRRKGGSMPKAVSGAAVVKTALLQETGRT